MTAFSGYELRVAASGAARRSTSTCDSSASAASSTASTRSTPTCLDRRLDAVRVRRGFLDDVAAGHVVEAREELVVLGEVGVAQHVRGDQRVLGERVAVHQEGVAGVAGEHHLEDLRMPHALAHQLVDVAHAEGPVRHAHRQAVDRDLDHEARRHELEVDRVVVEAEALRERFEPLRVLARASVTQPRACSREEGPDGVPHVLLGVELRSRRPAGCGPCSSAKISAICVSRGRKVATPPVST